MSPTVSTQALFITCVIDAIQGRTVATVDIPAFFLQSKLKERDDNIWIRFKGAMASALIKLDKKKYGPCCIERHGKKIIYAKAKKAIYGTLKGAIMAYKKLYKQLTQWDFVPNNYDHCTMNKMVNGSQLTVV